MILPIFMVQSMFAFLTVYMSPRMESETHFSSASDLSSSQVCTFTDGLIFCFVRILEVKLRFESSLSLRSSEQHLGHCRQE